MHQKTTEDDVRADDALRETRQMLEKAQQIARVGSWVWDIRSQKFSWSEEMFRIFDIAKDEFDGTNRLIDLAVHPDDRGRVLAAQREIQATCKPVPLEYRIVRKDGSIATVFANGECVFDDAGKLVRMVGTCQDVSLQKHHEEQIRRSQKMDALGKLTGGVAHDYNNMLGVILGYAGLLQDALANDPKLSDYIKEIQRAAERGATLSRKLLSFASHTATKEAVSDLTAVLTSAQDLLQKTLTPRITLTLDLVPDVWPINVDRGDLQDAILNLSINAMHAMELGGNLTLRTQNKQLNDRQSKSVGVTAGDYVVLSVIDTGCGMDAETLGRIFDPFFTTKGAQGAGLGLSMVYGFVQRSGGGIKVKSIPGKGSVFSLYFPRHARLPSVVPPAHAVDVSLLRGTETILVVDDEPVLLRLAQEMLAPQGYQVLTASNGADALSTLSKESVDLLLSDVIMPTMDGYQLAAKVAQLWPSVKIQLLSGFVDKRRLEHGNLQLDKNLLQKPFTMEELLVRVRALLDGGLTTSSYDKPTVLVMDDDESLRELFQINLERLGYQVILSADGAQAAAQYKESLSKARHIDAVILDVSVPGGMGGTETARHILSLNPRAKLIVSSGGSFGPEMTNYREYGFSGAIEKTFNREHIDRVIRDVLS